MTNLFGQDRVALLQDLCWTDFLLIVNGMMKLKTQE